MHDAINVELTTAEINRLVNILHDVVDDESNGDWKPSEADKVLLMKLVEALR